MQKSLARSLLKTVVTTKQQNQEYEKELKENRSGQLQLGRFDYGGEQCE